MNYQQEYDHIIETARSQNRVLLSRKDPQYVYYERHHIIPKCIGGTGSVSEWKTHPNIILLTAAEHFQCHKLLCLIHNNPSIWSAYWMMCNNNIDCSPEEYESTRAIIREKMKESNSKNKQQRIKSMLKTIQNYDPQKYKDWQHKRMRGLLQFHEDNPNWRSENAKKSVGKHHWTNGIENKFCFDKPGEDWYVGFVGRHNTAGFKHKIVQYRNSITGEIKNFSTKPRREGWIKI